MKKNQAYPSSYLSQDDVRAAPVRAVVDDIRIETVGGGDRAEEKPVMHFREKELKAFVFNQTNWAILEDAYGLDSDNWRGKSLELYLDPGIKFGREVVGGVRVRIPSDTTPFPLEAAMAEALKMGKTRDEFIAALRARGLTGYSSTKGAATARAVLAEWAGTNEPSVEDTIPF
ncbi:unnamed protein product [marine sediment metagenome]|uniref:Uncharacterized protein n=1 Tax=marine sediment metagenome TaxID=412755 RepID=X1ESH3_9ZZZZ